MTPKAGDVRKALKDLDLPNNLFNTHLDKIRTECVECGRVMETSMNVLIKILCQDCVNEAANRKS